jgi:hypothetical protein
MKGVAGAPRTMIFHTAGERDGAACDARTPDCSWQFAQGEGGYHYSMFALSKGLGHYLPAVLEDGKNFYAKIVDLLLSEQIAAGAADNAGAWPPDLRDDGSQIGSTAFAIMSLGRVGQPANVSGTVYEDTDGSGTRGAGEPGLGGWTVYADVNGNGVLNGDEPRDQTDGNGAYTLQQVPETTSSIREIGQAGFGCTAPPGCAYSDPKLFKLGANSTGLDFGNRRPPAAPAAAGAVAGAQARGCGSVRKFKIRVRIRRSLRHKVVAVQVRVAGRKVKARTPHGRWIAVVNLQTKPKGTYRVQIRLKLKSGRFVRGVRTYHTCVKRRPDNGPPPI